MGDSIDASERSNILVLTMTDPLCTGKAEPVRVSELGPVHFKGWVADGLSDLPTA